MTDYRNRSQGKLPCLMGFLLLFSLTATHAQVPATAILGEWQSAKKDSRISIYQQGKTYFGKIIWGTGQASKDEKNPDVALRNRDVIGLVILRNFVYDGVDTWKDGTIYDPRDGKTYACNMTLKETNTLRIRGYVGLSVFGRTELWTRVN